MVTAKKQTMPDYYLFGCRNSFADVSLSLHQIYNSLTYRLFQTQRTFSFIEVYIFTVEQNHLTDTHSVEANISIIAKSLSSVWLYKLQALHQNKFSLTTFRS